MPNAIIEIDSLDIQVIVDNEVDPLSLDDHHSKSVRDKLTTLRHHGSHNNHSEKKKLEHDNTCHGAHGVSMMITAKKDHKVHTLLFDAGPDGEKWEHNARILKSELAWIEHIHISHWHPQHSGALKQAIQAVRKAKSSTKVTVDVHPHQPDGRGLLKSKPQHPIPSFDELENAGANLVKDPGIHNILDDMFLVSNGPPPDKLHLLSNRKLTKLFSNENRHGMLADEERFMICNLKNRGLVIITGCSHAGLLNVCEQALSLVPNVSLYAIVGGYHLVGAKQEELQAAIDGLVELKPKILLAGHCTGLRLEYEICHRLPKAFVPCYAGTEYFM